jgi:hypothetical protein
MASNKECIPASTGPGFKPPAAPTQKKAPPSGAQSLKTSPNSHSRGKGD